MLEKYGVEYTAQSVELRNKMQKTCLKNHGVKTPSQKKEIALSSAFKLKNKSKKEKNIIKRKKENTCLERYGVKYNFQRNEFKQIVRNQLKDVNALSYSQLLNVPRKTRDIINNKENFIAFIEKLPKEKQTLCYISKVLEILPETVKSYFEKYDLIWKNYLNSFEYKIIEVLEKNRINYILHDRKIISPYEIDIILPDYKIGIECNGLYWHSIEFNKNNKYLHQKKSIKAFKAGYCLLHIFEFELETTDIEARILNFISNRIENKEYIIEIDLTSQNYLNFTDNYMIIDKLEPNIIFTDKGKTLYDAGKIILKKISSSIKYIEIELESEDVYDIEVPTYHNFQLANGLIVHNSLDTIQQTKVAGFDSKLISVDEIKNNECRPYTTIRNTFVEKRISLIKLDNLIKEITSLEKDELSGKINHPRQSTKIIEGKAIKTIGKDEIDSLTGAVYNANISVDMNELDYIEGAILVEDTITLEKSLNKAEAYFGYTTDTYGNIAVIQKQEEDTTDISEKIELEIDQKKKILKEIREKNKGTNLTDEQLYDLYQDMGNDGMVIF